MDRTWVIDLDNIPGLWRSGVNLRRAKYARKGVTREADDSLTYNYFIYDSKGRLYAVYQKRRRERIAYELEDPEVRDLIRAFDAPLRLDRWDMALYPEYQVDGDRIKTWSHGRFTFHPKPDYAPNLSPAGRMFLSESVFA